MKVLIRSYQSNRPIKENIDLSTGTKRIYTDQEIAQLEKLPEGTTTTSVVNGNKMDIERTRDGIRYKAFYDGGDAEGYLTFKELREMKE